MQRDDELRRFKTDINLVEFAQSCGYQVDRRESSRASVVMRSGDDKIVIATDQDGHGIYFSIRDDRDNGSIIDFVQRREHISLGQLRKRLRIWCPSSSTYQPRLAGATSKPQASTRDRQRVAVALAQASLASDGHPYLERERQIARTTLQDPRFASVVRIDARGNAIFPHRDADGFSGFEMKNADFTGFSAGGSKSLWMSANITVADKIVIVESAIDALSLSQMNPDEASAGFISVGGAMNDEQRELLRRLLTKVAERGAQILIGTDNDEPGHALAKQIHDLAPEGAAVGRLKPTAKDWNDELRGGRRMVKRQPR